MALHRAIATGDVAALRSLINTGVDLEQRNARGHTPLLAAVLNERASHQLVPWLIEAGANVNARGEQRGRRSSESVLSLAARHCDLPTVKSLILAGARVKEIDEGGYSILLYAAYRCPRELSDERLQVLKHLIAAGAPLDCSTKYHESALSVALNRGSLSMLRLLLEAGADPSVLKWTPLHRVIALESLNEVATALDEQPDLEAKDRWGMTPFLFALAVGRRNVAELLIKRGASQLATGRCGENGLFYAARNDDAELLTWLLSLGLDLNQTDEFKHTLLEEAVAHRSVACVERLIEAGADIQRRNEYGHTVVHDVKSPEIINLLAAAGGDLSDLTASSRRAFLHPSTPDPANDDVEAPPYQVSRQDFDRFHRRIFGRLNPERMNNPFWDEMVRFRVNAYSASSRFKQRSMYGDPVWCCDRFGQSLTALPDGRYVEIAGEHEDDYDPDFCIYNDVIVHDGHGEFDIYGYSRDVFPPTDFHTATLVGDQIYIIGNAGYIEDRRPRDTPVFRLSTEDWSICRVETHGENPGWISRHRARLVAREEIEIAGGRVDYSSEGEQPDRFRLNLATGVWTRLASGSH